MIVYFNIISYPFYDYWIEINAKGLISTNNYSTKKPLTIKLKALDLFSVPAVLPAAVAVTGVAERNWMLPILLQLTQAILYWLISFSW